ncbi:chitinase-like protein Idgf2 isoform X3 [Vigna radiata var. radiata]|uniref:Chitinase-like protein Idgf2 isoform X3 n=1 Tax=Vigna radiata var. radiata TaxID=3916 RepID=A0A3Q0F6I8_VIGRR|nr:chitinase-like protein Idgf2 isoform X3 [Vigna radiata var. radiata]
MPSNLIVFCTFFLILFSLKSQSFSDNHPSWVKAGYYYSGNEISASDIKATLFTHLLCAFAFINPTTYNIFINSSEEEKFSTFTNTVKLQNPSVSTLLSIRAGREDSLVFTSMLNRSSYRKLFIDSSIRTARFYGFHGIDLTGAGPSSEVANFGTLLKEWRAAITSEARNSTKPELLLVMAGYYLKASDSLSYPFDSMQKNLDWVHFVAYDYYLPKVANSTAFHAALYGSSDWDNTDSGIREWRRRGFSSKKLLIGLPYHGYAWKLVTPAANSGVGTPASGPAITIDGSMGYKFIKSYIKSFGNGVVSRYNASFVVNQFTVASTTWVNFDDVEVIRAKVSYARENGLLGYSVFQVGNDENWELSIGAAQAVDEEFEDHHKMRLLIIVLLATLTLALLFGIVFCYCNPGAVATVTKLLYKLRYLPEAEKDIDANGSDLTVFSYLTIKAATNNYSKDNRLGEGGFGTVYTSGYVPPEYVRKGIYSTKYDVYSFGVLLLQIISGKRTSCYYGMHEDMTLLEYAYELWREGRGVEFVEPSLDDDTASPCKIMRCMQIALLCVQENSVDRPSMLEVDSLLKNENAVIGTPKVPAFSVQKREDEKETCHSGVNFYSINDVTISQLAPR